MSEQKPDRLWSGLKLTNVAGGALAACCAAFLGSYLGVAGTVLGAAVASIVGSVGTEIYSRSLEKGRKRFEETIVPTFVKAPAAAGTPEVAAAADDKPSEIPDATKVDLAAEGDAAAAPTSPDKSDKTEKSDPIEGTAGAPDDDPTELAGAGPTKRQLRWGRIAMVAGALFVLAMGALSVVELIGGGPVNQKSSSGTTLGQLFTGNNSADTGTDAPDTGTTESPAPAPSETTTPTGPAATPTVTPTGSVPPATTTPVTPTTTPPTTTTPPPTATTTVPPTGGPDGDEGVGAPETTTPATPTQGASARPEE